MAKYLITVTETYRVDTEQEALNEIDEARKSSRYELKKYTSQKKEVKQKGEVIDEYILLSLTKQFTDAKEPETQIDIEYSERSAFNV